MLIFSKVFDKFDIAHKTCLIFVWGAVPLEMGRACRVCLTWKHIRRSFWEPIDHVDGILVLQQEMKRATENAAQTTFVAKTAFLFGFGPGIRPNSSNTVHWAICYPNYDTLYNNFIQLPHLKVLTVARRRYHPDLPNFLSFCTILLLFCIIFIMSLPHLDLCNLSLSFTLLSPWTFYSNKVY